MKPRRHPDNPDLWWCPKCEKYKPRSEFYNQPNGKPHGHCKKCTVAYNKDRYHKQYITVYSHPANMGRERRTGKGKYDVPCRCPNCKKERLIKMNYKPLVKQHIYCERCEHLRYGDEDGNRYNERTSHRHGASA
jgi:hypothetical protein